MSWLTGLFTDETPAPAAFGLVGLLALLVIAMAIARMRSKRGGMFIAGGRNRRQRLAVMDATAIDNRRRLVLVRRDDVEHLLLIGGHNDVLVESDIAVSNQGAASDTAGGAQATVSQARPGTDSNAGVMPMSTQTATGADKEKRPRPPAAPVAASPRQAQPDATARHNVSPMPRPEPKPAQPDLARSTNVAAPTPSGVTLVPPVIAEDRRRNSRAGATETTAKTTATARTPIPPGYRSQTTGPAGESAQADSPVGGEDLESEMEKLLDAFSEPPTKR